MLVKILLSHQAVTAADREPLIAGKNHDRVFGVSKLAQRFENSPDLVIQIGNTRIVVGQMLAHFALAFADRRPTVRRGS